MYPHWQNWEQYKSVELSAIVDFSYTPMMAPFRRFACHVMMKHARMKLYALTYKVSLTTNIPTTSQGVSERVDKIDIMPELCSGMAVYGARNQG